MKARTRVAVVTGGNRGIGFEICRQLAAKGLRVVLTARTLGKARAAAVRLKHLGLAVDTAALDVTDDASVKRLARFLLRNHGGVDVLVNNAGIYLEGGYGDGRDPLSVFHEPLAFVRRTMDTNLHGPYRLCQALVPSMVARGYGRVVNVSSGSGQLADMDGREAGYRMSKTALNALTRIWAKELAGTGVKVNALCPGWVRTDMGGPGAPRTVAQGADTAIWLATLPARGPNGGFFRDRKPIPW